MDPWKSTLTVKCRVLFQNRRAAKPHFNTDFLTLQSALWVILYPVACGFWELHAHIRDELPLVLYEKPLGEILVNSAEIYTIKM